MTTATATTSKGYYAIATLTSDGEALIYCAEYDSYKSACNGANYANAIDKDTIYGVVFVGENEDESVYFQGEGENDLFSHKHADMCPDWYTNWEQMYEDWYHDAVRNPEFDSSLVEQVHCPSCGDVLVEDENVVCDECDYALYYTNRYRIWP